MLKNLQITQFTAFAKASFEFSEGLNVIIGDNGTGKTHVLKLGYLFSRAWTDLRNKRLRVTPQSAENYLGERLAGLFRVTELGALIKQGNKNGARLVAGISGHIPTARFRLAGEIPSPSPGVAEPMPWDVKIQRSSNDTSGAIKARLLPDVVPDKAANNAFLPRQIFIPSKEIVSLFKGLVGLFDTYRDFPLDDTYRDLAVLLSTLEAREPSPEALAVTHKIQKLLGGRLKLQDDDLLFVRDDGSTLLSQLMAEGHRKLAMLVYLLRAGIIEVGSTVYWDEPEANLNPAAIKLLADALHLLSASGIQVILATHSLFLMRELEILQLSAGTHSVPSPRYFGLGLERGTVTVTQGDDIADIEPIVSLDESLLQTDRFLQADRESERSR